ncbi:hypothetical protein AB0C65_13325 [Nocardia sp. NPDC048505]|uniref:hypothetical protein n=1 Tax=Nocardia sp. NPDC048505 TaxID=3155756 RepID=UPI0033E62FB4
MTVENDPDLLRKAAQTKTSHVHDRLDSVLRELDRKLGARGEPWGQDKFGTQFYGNYETSRQNATTNITNASTSFVNFTTGQVRTADTMKKQDQANRDGLTWK